MFCEEFANVLFAVEQRVLHERRSPYRQNNVTVSMLYLYDNLRHSMTARNPYESSHRYAVIYSSRRCACQ